MCVSLTTCAVRVPGPRAPRGPRRVTVRPVPVRGGHSHWVGERNANGARKTRPSCQRPISYRYRLSYLVFSIYASRFAPARPETKSSAVPISTRPSCHLTSLSGVLR